jgi:hypothetical protein
MIRRIHVGEEYSFIAVYGNVYVGVSVNPISDSEGINNRNAHVGSAVLSKIAGITGASANNLIYGSSNSAPARLPFVVNEYFKISLINEGGYIRMKFLPCSGTLSPVYSYILPGNQYTKRYLIVALNQVAGEDSSDSRLTYTGATAGSCPT